MVVKTPNFKRKFGGGLDCSVLNGCSSNLQETLIHAIINLTNEADKKEIYMWSRIAC